MSSKPESGPNPEALQRRLDRERAARKSAELLLTEKSAELYHESQKATAARERLALALWAGNETIWSLQDDQTTLELVSWDQDSQEENRQTLQLSKAEAFVHPDDRMGFNLSWRMLLSGVRPVIDLTLRIMRDNGWRWVRLRGKRIEKKVGLDREIAIGTIKDITELKQSQHQSQLMATAFSESRDAMAILDKELNFLEVNDAAQKLFDLANREDMDTSLYDLLSEIPKDLSKASRFETHYERSDGKRAPIEVTMNLFESDIRTETLLIGIFRDISERKKAQKDLERMATTDALTGLANRVTFQKHLTEFHNDRRNDESIAIIFVDLDGFKAVNDDLGHEAGDKLLNHVAETLLTHASERTRVARWGGDEFLMIMRYTTASDQPLVIAEQLLKDISAPFYIQDVPVRISASLGLAKYPDHTEQLDDLVRFADAAMYDAKNQGKNQCCVYTEGLAEQAKNRISLISGIRQALDQDEFDFVLQPKFNQNKQIIGAEMLARWQPVIFGHVSPGVFIPLIESHGLAIEFGRLVINNGARNVQLLNSFGYSLPVAINLSAIHLMSPSLEEDLMSACERYSIDHELLELEVTESVFLQDNNSPIERLERLRQQGFRIAMDDFGTGYSSLSYLRTLPFDIVKIDRSFVVDADHHDRAELLLSGIVQMCQSLDMSVVAEGIETEGEFGLLTRLNVEHYQGFLLGKPMGIIEFLSRLREQ